MLPHLQKYLLLYLLVFSVANVMVFGIPHNSVWQGDALGSDALGYSQYARNIVSGNGFNMDGTGFDAVREPGYPAFLSFIYLVFGDGSMKAVIIVQTIILALMGYLAYLIARRFADGYAPTIIALGVSLLPYYGYYAAEYMTELLFAFMLFLCVYAALKLTDHPNDWRYQVLCGAVFAVATLVRVQMLLFPLLWVAVMLVLYRDRFRPMLRTVIVVGVTYLVPILLWSSVVYAHTGSFMLTEGRQEMLLHVRAVRSTLSYPQLVGYAKEWVIRSTSGGTRELPLVDTYDLKAIKNEYKVVATSPESIERIKQADIKTIKNHLGHYLFGNATEVMKLMYIEHDYADYMNRYFRLAWYVFMYGLFFTGLWFVARRWRGLGREQRLVVGFALLVIAYHLVMLTFLETVPRFNTPLHGLYILVGALGVWLARAARARRVTT